jgi:hypothetical protein
MASLALAQDVTGDWHGTLSVNGAELRLVLHISKNSDGSLKATLDSIDQNANGIPVNSATLRGSALSLKVDAVHGWYQGKVNAAGSEIAGTWTQGAPLELTFHRGGIPAKAAAKPAKPSDIDGDWLGTIDTNSSPPGLSLRGYLCFARYSLAIASSGRSGSAFFQSARNSL